MDPIIAKIGVCNARVVRHTVGGDKAALSIVSKDLAEQCNAIQQLNNGDIKNMDAFVRYLLRNMDFEERIMLFRLSQEIREYVEQVVEVHNELVEAGYVKSNEALFDKYRHFTAPHAHTLTERLADHMKAR